VLVCGGAASAGVLSGCLVRICGSTPSYERRPRGSCTCHWGGRHLCSAPVCVGPNSNWPGGLGHRAAWVMWHTCGCGAVQAAGSAPFLAAARRMGGQEGSGWGCRRGAAGGADGERLGGGGAGGLTDFYPPGCYLFRRDGMSRPNGFEHFGQLASSSNYEARTPPRWRISTAGTAAGGATLSGFKSRNNKKYLVLAPPTVISASGT
jgi:hypothetical protein